MGFASGWLESGTLFPELISEAPDADTGIIVVVPAFDEPCISELLDSLAHCKSPSCGTEVLIIVNATQNATAESLRTNLKTLSDIEAWRLENSGFFFRTFAVNLGQPAIKGWGVGLARKAGMDEALRRFNAIGNPDGVIVSLDADCTVQDNYFVSIENELLRKIERKGCSIYFEHPLSGDRFPEVIYSSICQYELHLRYYYQAILFTGFPGVHHTVGSAIAVKSLPYVKAGGMNRREAGEDFYFVQKMISCGGYFNLNSTTVFPSPRASGRVPFGTGPTVGKMAAIGEKQLLTYNPSAFRDLKDFFGKTSELYYSNPDDIDHYHNDFPESLKSFLSLTEWKVKINEIKANTSKPESFRKRFFDWFNMFRIVKYLNFAHKSCFEKIPIMVASRELLQLRNIDYSNDDSVGMLQIYRRLEKPEQTMGRK